MSDRAIGYVLLILAMMTVGSTVVASKLISADLSPFTATAWRFGMALPVLLVIAAFFTVSWPKLNRRDWALLWLQAGAGSLGYTALLIGGLSWMSAGDAGVIIGTLPAVAALFAILVLREKAQLRVLVAAGLATVGVMAVAWTGRAPGSLMGVLMVLGAVVCESAFILLNKRMARPLLPLLQTMMMTGMGFVLAMPLALLESSPILPPVSAFAPLLWYALVPTVGGFLLWYAGAAQVSGSEAAAVTAVASVTAVGLSALWLDERVHFGQVLGMILVVLAILLVSRPKAKQRDSGQTVSE